MDVIRIYFWMLREEALQVAHRVARPAHAVVRVTVIDSWPQDLGIWRVGKAIGCPLSYLGPLGVGGVHGLT